MNVKNHRLAWTALAIGMLLGLSRGPWLPAGQPAAPSTTQPIEKMMGELKTIADLVKQLEDNDPVKRKQATERLLAMGPATIEPLKRVLEGKPHPDLSAQLTHVLRGLLDKRRKENDVTRMHNELSKRIDLPAGIPNPSTLKDALDFLSDRTCVTFVLDENAFAADELHKAAEAQVGLRRMMGVRLDTVLWLLLSQVKGQKHTATYLVRPEFIEITSTRHTDPRSWTEDARDAVPRVNIVLDRDTVEEGLHRLAEATGSSVVRDERLGGKVQRTVSARFNNVPLDTAVRLLVDQADLKPVLMDHAIYVTSKGNAKELEAEEEKRAAAAALAADAKETAESAAAKPAK
jgi:hypothetical protein